MGAPSSPPHDRRGPPTGPLLVVVNRGARVISDVKCGVWRAGLCDPPVRPSPVPSHPSCVFPGSPWVGQVSHLLALPTPPPAAELRGACRASAVSEPQFPHPAGGRGPAGQQAAW